MTIPGIAKDCQNPKKDQENKMQADNEYNFSDKSIVLACIALVPVIFVTGWLIARLIDLIAWSLGYGIGMMLNA